MIYRAYTSEDLAAVVRLFQDTVHTVCARDYTSKQLDAWAPKELDMKKWQATLLAHHTIVAEEDGVIAGFGDMDDTGYLDRLYVHKDFQRQGIAAAICDRLEAALSPELSPVRFTTHASITAKPFFEKRGYRIVKEQTVERRGIRLTNYVMEKTCRKAE